MSSWKKIKLGNILIESKVEALNSNSEERIRVLLNANGVIKRPLMKETEGATKYFERKAGQFIYGKQNLHKGAFGIIPKELDGFSSSSDLPAFDVAENCLPEWVDYFLRQGNFYESLIDIAKGAATKRIQPKELFKVEIPLPSISIQKEVIESFVKKETKQKEIDSEIQTQKQLLTNLKQAILQEAIQGKLTQDWRTRHPELVEGQHSAEHLLQRIKTEKAQLIKEGKIKKEKPLPKITQEEIPFELPGGWVWCKIDSLVYSIKDDIRTGPFGTALQKSEHKESGVPVLGIESIGKQGVFTGINKIFVSDKKAQALKSFEVKGLDIIVSRSGTIGELCLLPESIGKALISTNLMKISLNHKVINPLFFCHLFEGSTTIIDQMKELCKGSTRLFITQKILNNLFFQIPPLEEQKEIVKKVATLMQKCKALEEEINQSETNAQMLMQAVLKEAFEG